MSQQEARLLSSRLGPSLLSLMCGAARRLDSARWCIGELEMTPEQLARLRIANQLFERIASTDGDNVARAWFTGSSCGNDQRSPAEAIRDDCFEEARAAANAFIECVPL